MQMTDETRRLIRVRTNKGARFKRSGFGKKPQISDSWRKPRGQHNKQREQKKARGNLPKPGFGSPIAVRGMHPSGFFEVLVHSGNDLKGLDPNTQAIRIAATVGNRKRSAIQEKAISAGLKVLNAKAAKPGKKQVAAPEEEKAKEQVQKKAPAQKVKPAAEKKAEPQKAKKETGKEKPASLKEKQEKAQAEPVEEPKKETKQKAQKPKPETGAEPKAKKTSKVKAETAKESKPAKKAASKPAGKPKKKESAKEVKSDE